MEKPEAVPVDLIGSIWAALLTGASDLAKFLSTHLISGMIPAFLIAGAIAVFMDKERITRLLGPKASAWISFPVAAFSGALLTVCSCGVIPIFTGILTRGAGIGPAFTFLFAAPAINLIALTYTYTFMGIKVALGRVITVLFCAIAIGLIMRILFSDEPGPLPTEAEMAEIESLRTDGQMFFFFFMLIFFMLTSTGFFDSYTELRSLGFLGFADNVYGASILKRLLPKLFLLAIEALVVIVILRRWFHPDEIKLWLNKSWSLFKMIFPKILLGIFICGFFSKLFPLTNYMTIFSENTLSSNVVISFFGTIMYLGTIVGVNVIATFIQFGMHMGPAMTFLLAGPSVSLPELLALLPIIGRKKATAYLVFVIITTTLSGFVFGMLY